MAAFKLVCRQLMRKLHIKRCRTQAYREKLTQALNEIQEEAKAQKKKKHSDTVVRCQEVLNNHVELIAHQLIELRLLLKHKSLILDFLRIAKEGQNKLDTDRLQATLTQKKYRV